jgi:hypothetical protein
VRRAGRSLAALLAAVALLGWPASLLPAGLLPPGGLPAGLPIPALGPAPVAAATPDLTLVTDTRYVVQPDRARVHVVVDITATNRKSDTVTRTYYFESANLAVLPGTKAFTIASDGAKPTVRVTSATRTYTLLSIGFGKRLTSGQTQRLRLQFDLPDPGGAATRDVRVGSSLVSFPVWAYASDGTAGSSVTVIFPAGYSVTATAGTLPPSSTGSGGTLVLRTGPLARPLAYYAYLTAERPATLASSTVRTTVGATPVVLTLERWADDPAWAGHVGDAFKRGLPVLGTAIGLPYPVGAPLTVRESTSRTTGGYAGLFDAGSRTVEVAYYADAFVALHEAAHVWFNGTLLADRWANEAFASYYAAAVAKGLGVTARVETLTPKLSASAVPLNAWGAVGREDPAVEDYAYAASYRLATLIAARAGPAVLPSVWKAAAAHEAAYQPVTPGAARETVAAAPDWRGLLDLLEERTGLAFTDLWTTWVARPADLPLLAARTAARTHYRTTLDAAGDWELSPVIREAMDAWQFSDAGALLDQADRALAGWTALEALARSHALTPPGTTKAAFEGPGGPAVALAEIRAETAALGDIDATEAIARRDRGVFESIGLLGQDPAIELAAARTAYGAGDLPGVAEHAAAARAAWLGADDRGRRRAAVGLFTVLVVGGTLAVVLAAVRRRRRERHPALPAPRIFAQATPMTAAAREGRYGTLEPEPITVEPGPGTAERVVQAERGEVSDVTATGVATDTERGPG